MWNVQYLGDFGSLCSGVFAGIAVIYAIIQILEAKRAAREANALQSHREYLSLCLQHPELSSSLLFAKTNSITSFNDIRETLTRESESYLWLVSILLNNCEQVLESVKDDPAWRKVLREQLRIHLPSLDILWPYWGKGYGEKLNRLWAEVKETGPEKDWIDYVRSNAVNRTATAVAPAI
ncbi:hypothetical protein ELG88_18015 [Rhizobium leguminosarum]|uniref:hypothetical protein n=1 Tax=Rhizobium leguminosarum TaxID=384 RepID=UPI0010313B82|nr:hypothetical protein [Rhizobium leguminosarum]TBF36982.1 hypothetical protein ELG88_18015 [Rhizobium leguminosarum]